MSGADGLANTESAATLEQWYGRIEATFNELGDDDLSTRLSTFFGSWSNLANKPQDLKPCMKLPGIVTNVTAFGAFVDVGVHQDGLVHVSQLADTFVKDPGSVVRPQQKVMVTVTEIDLPRNRIALSMRSKPEIGPKTTPGAGGGQRTSPGGARPGSAARSGAATDSSSP